jgi:peptidoglycan/xylan/chitin deacetylase (PgdA/CDA1 family)
MNNRYRQLTPGRILRLSLTWLAGLLAAGCWTIISPHSAGAEPDHSSAVVLIYHRFGEDRYPSTNVRLDQFEAHIAELKSGGYHFLPLSQIVDAIRNSQPLPDRTIAITVDDAYETAFTEAWPRLKAAGIPMTLFVATDPVDGRSATYMSWDQIRQLAADGVEIAHHGASHHHMVSAGLAGSLADIERASLRFQEELGFVPDIFAYPYGEYSMEIRQALEDSGFAAAFAQYSSVARIGSDAFALPRFPVNERYGEIDRFRLVVNARSLPVANIIPQGPIVAPDNNPPPYGFSLTESVVGLAALACYPSHMDEAAGIEILGGRRVEIRFQEPFPEGRHRINCTLPGPDRRWYWFGKFFYGPPAVTE